MPQNRKKLKQLELKITIVKWRNRTHSEMWNSGGE